MLRVLWNSCQLFLPSLVTRCPARLQKPTLFLGLLVSLFCTGCPELLSASCEAGRGEPLIAPRPSKKREGNNMDRGPALRRPFVYGVLPHLSLQWLQYFGAHSLIRKLNSRRLAAGEAAHRSAFVGHSSTLLFPRGQGMGLHPRNMVRW